MFNFLNISKFFLFASLFSVLIITTSTLFPFIVGKMIFFRVCVELALAFYLLHWAFGNGVSTLSSHTTNRKPAPNIVKNKTANNFKTKQIALTAWQFIKNNPIFIAVAAFASIFVLAGFLGVNPNFSFWSNFERGEGGFQMFHYFAFFALLVLVMKSERDWRNMFIAFIVAAGLMVGYGILAISGFDGFIAPTYGWKDRFYGSLGNPDYVTTYLTFALFFIAYLWFTAKNKKYWNWIAPALLVFFSIFFLLSGTRGGFLGLAAGIILGVIYLIFVSPSKKWRFILAGFLISLVTIYGVLFSLKETSLIKDNSLSRFFNISFDQSAQYRVFAWNIAVEAVKERPFFGWGPENYSIAFDKHFDTRFYIVNVASETWFDRAHSIFFDHLAEAGILGLLSYLGIFIAFYLQFFRSWIFRQQKIINSHWLLVANSFIFALPIAYLVSGVTLFEVLPMYLSLFLFLAFANYKLSVNENL